jgi:hypothetical protein
MRLTVTDTAAPTPITVPEAERVEWISPPRAAFLQKIAWVALALAFLLRVVQYLLNRSLWMDEAYLSLNLVHRSFAGLWRPLDYHQGAPIGFLLLEKSAVHLLGTSEFALRLLPLLAGLVSVILFYELANKVNTAAAPIAVGLFALSPSLIYYSSEVKQYSCDVAIALLLYCLTIDGSTSEWKPAQVGLLGLVGSIAIWISHPSVFVLAGIGSTIFLGLVGQKDWSKLRRLSFAFLMWAASLIMCYLVTLRNLAHDPELLAYWKLNFMPFPPRSVADFKWFLDSFFAFFSSTAGLQFVGLAALVFIVGGVSMFARNRQCLLLLLSPAIPTLLASGLHKYPFGGRLTLFLVPATLLLVAEGAEVIRSSNSSRLPVLGLVLIGLLFLDPGVYVLHHFARPFTEVARPGVMLLEEIKPVMAFVRTHEQPTDVVYVFDGAQQAFDYYSELDGFPLNNVQMGTAAGDDPHNYTPDLDRLRGKRVWVLISHTHGAGGVESKYLMFDLDMIGKKLDFFASAGAEVDLYDLTGATSLPAVPVKSEAP